MDRGSTGKRVSYVMTTRNKLGYLQESVPRFLGALSRADEELIVVDGASTDGSREFLREAARDGAIDWFLSEPDHCEAHALNKALLAARGDYITILTDDDVFDFSVLRQLHAYLDANPEVSVAYPSGADTRWDEQPYVVAPPEIDVSQTRDLIADRNCAFPFSGLGLTLRRSALPEIGLFDLNLKRVDMALSWRLTASPVRIAGCTAFGYVRILNEKSLTVTMRERNFEEKQRIARFYGGGDQPASGRQLAGELARRVWARFAPATPLHSAEPAVVALAAHAPVSPAERMRVAEEWLEQANATRAVEFVTRR